MDSKIVKTNKKLKLSGAQMFVAALVVILIFLIFRAGSGPDSVTVKRSDIVVATVKQGDLTVQISGYGKLVSNKKRLITATSQATVKEILQKAGTSVTSETILVELENPELHQALENAEQALAEQQANVRQIKLNNQREMLNEQDALEQLKAAFATAKLKRQAEQKLVQSGIVSQLTYQQSVLQQQQLQSRIDIAGRRAEQLVQVHEEAVNIALQQQKQRQGKVNLARSRLAQLQVRAGMSGVVQNMPLSLGQSVTAGQEVALIGSVTDLVALIKVPQSQAQLVQLGFQAEVDTRTDKITGTVVRIDPVVKDNTVDVEIAFASGLPDSARVALNVDATINASTLQNVTYIDRPASIKAHSQASLFLIDEQQSSAVRREVSFGRQAGRFIEVTQGASAFEQFIVSQLSQLPSDTNLLEIE